MMSKVNLHRVIETAHRMKPAAILVEVLLTLAKRKKLTRTRLPAFTHTGEQLARNLNLKTTLRNKSHMNQDRPSIKRTTRIRDWKYSNLTLRPLERSQPIPSLNLKTHKAQERRRRIKRKRKIRMARRRIKNKIPRTLRNLLMQENQMQRRQRKTTAAKLLKKTRPEENLLVWETVDKMHRLLLRSEERR